MNLFSFHHLERVYKPNKWRPIDLNGQRQADNSWQEEHEFGASWLTGSHSEGDQVPVVTVALEMESAVQTALPLTASGILVHRRLPWRATDRAAHGRYHSAFK